MLRIVTDGAADVPSTWEKEYDIKVVPINIHFGEKTFIQGVDMDFDAFYKEVGSNKNHPKTSQPSPHQFAEFYKKHYSKDDTILSIHITSKLSGTYASCVAAAEELKGQYNIIPFDSQAGTMGTSLMCRTARKMANEGKSVEEIIKYLESIRDKIHIVLTLETLEYARRSGRVGTLSAALASVLNVKPIARLQDGLVQMVDKVRTRKNALAKVIEMGKDLVGDKPVSLGIVHARDLESGKFLLEEARKNFNVKEFEMTELSISLAINFGPGTVGMILYPVD
ncbi:MAG: DegV family protein [Anaerolineales bacterium]|nr:DegV family protein [Anaerolineales bacterium]